jgi:hypothetical protein
MKPFGKTPIESVRDALMAEEDEVMLPLPSTSERSTPQSSRAWRTP